MASVHIKSTDDATYLEGPISFENALEVIGLKIEHIKDLSQQLAEINGDILQNMVINASFDNSTRHLKLFSKTRTVATVFIPASAPE